MSHKEDEIQTIDSLYEEQGDTATGVNNDFTPEDHSQTDTGNEPPVNQPTSNQSTEPENDSRSGIERLLSDYGVEGGMIKFDDGQKIHINDLPAKEQYAVLESLTKNSRPTIEQLNDLSEDEVSFLNLARESGRPITDVIADLANSQLEYIRLQEESQSIDWNNMSDDAVYLAFLRDKNPDMSDEDLQDDLDKASGTRTYKSTVEGIRKDFTAAQERERESYTNQMNHRFDQEIEGDRRQIVESVAAINDIAGFDVNDDIKNELLGDILELNDVGDSLLLETIFSSPERILKHAWFEKYGERAIDDMEKYYRQEISKAYTRGKDEALGKFPESGMPARIGGLGKRAEERPNDGYGMSPDAKSIDDLYED